MMSDEQELLQQSLAGLSPDERAQVLKILQQYAQEGESALEQDIKWADWEEIPVDIETFLHDKQYLGKGLYDNEGRFTVFPYWEEKLKDIFPTNITTKYNNIVLTGSIGIGKSFVAVICILYMLYRLLCLKDPYTFFGMQLIDKLSISFMNITIENAKGVALDKMNQLILSSEWFMAHGEMHGTTNLVYHPDKHIEFIASSSNNQIVGRAIFCLDGNTIIKTVDGDFKIQDLVNKEIKVISIDESGNTVISNNCTVQPTIKTTEEYEIELEDGTIIHCTPNHKFMLKDGTYKEAQNLTESDELAEGYLQTYDAFIQHIINSRGQHNISKDEYWEGHHILPKCLGGKGTTKSKHQNIIWLYPEEHYIAHKLLALEHPDNRALVAAWEMMIYPKGKTKRNYQVSKEDYAIARRLWSKHMAIDNPGCKKTGHPWNYGLKSANSKQKSFIYINNGIINKKIKVDEQLPNGFIKGRLAAKPKDLLTKEQKYAIYSKAVSGKNNPMYGKGYKISGANNGHATIRYFFEDKIFECGNDLINYLNTFDKKISNSTIRKLRAGSVRVLREHPILQKVIWEAK